MTKGLAMVLAAFLTGLPSLCFASEAVKLKFTNETNIYLYVSFAFGIIAVVAGFMFRRQVLSRPAGDEKMQEVGKAIEDGALAYLSQQVRTMAIFVVLLMIGLFFLYMNSYGTTLAAFVALSFLGGVAASYIAGYVGMLMAVKANTRTAHAALTSYKTALETAFQSGAVAGLITVGMGLIGATLIFLLAKGEAMKLLIGFGFGGSLAALFMRVGGGIYTKAADVGADLVGKVEAGIPEDDARNPATIADNVGDNVGDCAGMAADIFESYEVTLVAAIVLGAATAAIFDQATWMKLILFALMARGVGILASIFGVITMKGNDDINSDPLKALRGGFSRSAIVAGIGTLALAWFMMGGLVKDVGGLSTNQLVAKEQYEKNDIAKIREVRADLAKERKVELYQVKAEDVQKDPRLASMNLDKPEGQQIVQRALAVEPDENQGVPQYRDYSRIDFNDSSNKVLSYAVPNPEQKPGGKPMTDLKTAFGGSPVVVTHLRLTRTVPPPAAQKGKPAPPPPAPQVQEVYFGPIPEKQLNDQIAKSQNPNLKIEVLDTAPVILYSNPDGKIVAAVSNKFPGLSRLTGGQGLAYFATSADVMNKLVEDAQKNPSAAPSFPTQNQIKVAAVENNVVEWWRFAICIIFGILMAFAIELLTDYYVSTHKKPVQEVANVATAGPAPMIIQGFAYGQESSVFSVFAIVLALMVPLILFPVQVYGSYILSFYGIALVGLGLLTTTGYILAMDTFGPISDNAQGVFEMSGAGHTHPEASKAVQRLDAAGNTTKALTKGFAIATAVVAAVALFHSYIEESHLVGKGLPLDVPQIFLGLLVGAAAPYLFSAFTINAVGRAAFQLINEVRRQFRADAGIMAGTSKPDYGRCVAIVTAAAQKELLGPGILAIALPAIVAFGFSIGQPTTMINGSLYNLSGAQALGGFLAGAIVSGQLLAVLLANSGGMWDNAKKLIEDGLHGGKGTEAHRAGVVCDTVGDPFKDTAGPALNPLIKVMNLVALLLAPVVIMPLAQGVLVSITIGCFIALAGAFWWSKRGSLSSELTAVTAGGPSIAQGTTAVTIDKTAVGVGSDEDR